MTNHAERPQRTAEVRRVTGETDIHLHLQLDGSGQAELDFPIPFLRHMLH